jgi:hypothetical protein
VTAHPAVYSPQILAAIGDRVAAHSLVLDPFAGTGKIHELRKLGTGIRTIGLELEPEWATMHGDTLRGDATDLPNGWTGLFDVVATSPCYGNRMADCHEARDPSRRITYRHSLGRMPSDGSAAVMQWGPKYRALHEKAWAEAWRVLKAEPGGIGAPGRLLLNVKDHVRGGQLQYVPEWHMATCLTIGFDLIDAVRIPVAGMRYGENHAARVDHEWLYVLEKNP